MVSFETAGPAMARKIRNAAPGARDKPVYLTMPASSANWSPTGGSAVAAPTRRRSFMARGNEMMP
jgi:hypothetical protein